MSSDLASIAECTQMTVWVPDVGYVMIEGQLQFNPTVGPCAGPMTKLDKRRQEKGQRRRAKQRLKRSQKKWEGSDAGSVSSIHAVDDSSYCSSPMSTHAASGHSSGESTPISSGSLVQLAELPPSLLATLLRKAAWVCLVRRIEGMCLLRDLVWRWPTGGGGDGVA